MEMVNDAYILRIAQYEQIAGREHAVRATIWFMLEYLKFYSFSSIDPISKLTQIGCRLLTNNGVRPAEIEAATCSAWQYLDNRKLTFDFRSAENNAIRAALCLLQPAVDAKVDLVELLGWFLQFLNKITDNSEHVHELIEAAIITGCTNT